jgi:EAL domain-containing protein (putative c-di-GMP-specific phosphodiesterase class I)
MSCASSCAVPETAWFERAWREDRFETWFEPIVDTAGADDSAAPQRILAHKCLLRLLDARVYGDAEIFDAAESYDRPAFEVHARCLAIRSAAAQEAATQERDARYFIGFTPASLRKGDAGMKTTLAVLEECGVSPRNIVFEARKSDLTGGPGYARRVRDFIGRRGFGFALDAGSRADAGKCTGAGSCADWLQMVNEVQPEYIVLDQSLVHHVERPVCAATIRKMVEFADRFGAAVIAKDVERTRTMENLWLLGVQYMRGYLFGSPAPRTLRPAVRGTRVVAIGG